MLWDPTIHCLRSGQQIPKCILFKSLVDERYQTYLVHHFPPSNLWPNKGRQQDDCTHYAHVQLEASMDMGCNPPLCLAQLQKSSP